MVTTTRTIERDDGTTQRIVYDDGEVSSVDYIQTSTGRSVRRPKTSDFFSETGRYEASVTTTERM